MTDEVSGSLVETLRELARSDLHVYRIDLASTEELEGFERNMAKKTEELANVAALAGLRPAFVFWKIDNLWPKDSGGWVLLLRKAVFQGRMLEANPGNGQREAGR